MKILHFFAVFGSCFLVCGAQAVHAAQRRTFVPDMPKDLDLTRAKLSSKQNWRVALVSPKEMIKGTFENFEVCFETDKRFFVEVPFPEFLEKDVQFLMPQHGHGLLLEFKPKSLAPEKKGCVSLEGVKFHMPGWWQLTMNWKGLGEEEAVTFNFLVK